MFDSAEDFSAWFGAPLEALREGGAAAKRGGAQPSRALRRSNRGMARNCQ